MFTVYEQYKFQFNMKPWGLVIVDVYFSVPPTITSKIDAVVQLDAGQSANLLCQATGIPAPNITWVRADGDPLPGKYGALLRVRKILVIEFK